MAKTLTLITLLSLFAGNSFAGMKCLDGLRRVITNKPREEFRVLKGHDRYWNYRKYESGEVFGAKKNKLYQDIDFWAQVGERDIRLRELRKKQARSLVDETIRLDRPEISLIILRPMFTKIQTKFFKMQRNNLISEKLLNARGLIVEGRVDAAKEIIRELQTKYLLRDNVGTNVGKIDRVLTRLENENIDITISFAKRYAEYTETISTLQGLAGKGGKLGEKAKEVLELLHPKNTIAEHLEHFSNFEGIEHVGKETLREIVVNNRISEVIYLKGELRKEKWSSIVSRLSATQIYELTDAIAKRFPWLNTPSIRSQIRYTIDNKEVLTHYPNIDRMVADGNSPKVMWEYLLSLDARDRTTDSLIRTFSRRIDTRVEWRSVKDYGALRAKKLREQGHNYDLEVRLYEKMIEMEKSVLGLPPLAPWHRSGNTKFVRFILDGILLGAFAYGSYYFLSDLLPEAEEEKDEVLPSEARSLFEASIGPETNEGNADSLANPASGSSSSIGESPIDLTSLPVKPMDITERIEEEAFSMCGELQSCP